MCVRSCFTNDGLGQCVNERLHVRKEVRKNDDEFSEIRDAEDVVGGNTRFVVDENEGGKNEIGLECCWGIMTQDTVRHERYQYLAPYRSQGRHIEPGTG